MDFDYTDEQRQLRDEARRFLDAQSPIDRARAVLEGADPFDAELWSRIAGQGWLGVAIPEAHGGLGLGYVELAAIAEEIGASLAPLPFGPTLYLFADAIARLGSAAQRDAWLPPLIAGELIGCAALHEGPGELDPETIEARVAGDRLDGVKAPVVAGMAATHALVLARDGEDLGLYVATLDQPAVRREELEAIDGSIDVARIIFDGASVERLCTIDAPAIVALLARAAALTAFEQIGGADRCLRDAIAYVSARKAFGGPVGRFQAVKHKLADIYVANQLARSHAYHGIWAVDAEAPQLIAAAAAARIAASDAYWLASKEAMHLHGAIGFTWEHDAHLYYRRAHHLSLALGAPQWWKDRLFEALAAAPPEVTVAPSIDETVATSKIAT